MFRSQITRCKMLASVISAPTEAKMSDLQSARSCGVELAISSVHTGHRVLLKR